MLALAYFTPVIATALLIIWLARHTYNSWCGFTPAMWKRFALSIQHGDWNQRAGSCQNQMPRALMCAELLR